MACCCFSHLFKLPKDEEAKPLIVDVNKVLSDEAWTMFKISLGSCRRKCIKRRNYEIEVPENYFAYDQVGKPKFEPIDPLLGNCMGKIKAVSTSNLTQGSNENETQRKDNTTTTTTTTTNGTTAALAVPNGGNDGGQSKEKKNGADHEDDHGRPDEAVSLDTTFNNGTSEAQTYQFKFSKVRTSRLDVSYQKGFTVGGKASFNIGLPKTLADASLGLTAETRFEMKESKGHHFEESVTMEATSDIRVTPNSKYVAKVQLEERMINVKFSVRVRMSMPQKRAPIYIRRKSDKAVVCVHGVDNLEDIFCDYEDKNQSDNKFPCAEKVPNSNGTQVDFIVEGIVKGNLACDHTINLTSEGTNTPA